MVGYEDFSEGPLLFFRAPKGRSECNPRRGCSYKDYTALSLKIWLRSPLPWPVNIGVVSHDVGWRHRLPADGYLLYDFRESLISIYWTLGSRTVISQRADCFST